MIHFLKYQFKAFKIRKNESKKFSLFKSLINYSLNSSQTKKYSYNSALVLLFDIGDYLTFRNFIPYYYNELGDNCIVIANKAFKDIYEKYDNSFTNIKWINKSDLKDINGLKSFIDDMQQLKINEVILPVYNPNAIPDLICLSGFKESKIKITSPGKEYFQLPYFHYFLNAFPQTEIIKIEEQFEFHEFYRNQNIFNKLFNINTQLEYPSFNETMERKNQIVIFCGANHKSRQWSTNEFSKCIKTIENAYPSKYEFVICGGINDIIRSKKIEKQTGGIKKVINKTGKTSLLELITIIEESILVISADTSAQHIAASSQTSCIVVSNGVNFHRFVNYPPHINWMRFITPPLFNRKNKPIWSFAESSLINTIKGKVVGEYAISEFLK